MSFENTCLEFDILATNTMTSANCMTNTTTTETETADDSNNKQQLDSPIPSTDSAYGQSPAMKWAGKF